MRKKVQLKVTEEDQQIWMILDDTGVLLEGPGVEMVQAFCHLAGQSNYTLTKRQLAKYDVGWEGTLRLVRQQSTFKRSARERDTKKTNKRKEKLRKLANAFAATDDEFFD